VREANDAKNAISQLYERHQRGLLGINKEGVRVIAERGYLPQDLKRKTLTRLERILGTQGTEVPNRVLG
jgi:hypothetical protein